MLCVFFHCLISCMSVRSKSLSLSLALPVLFLFPVCSSFEVIECALEGRSDSWEKDRNGGWKREDERIFWSCRIGEMWRGGLAVVLHFCSSTVEGKLSQRGSKKYWHAQEESLSNYELLSPINPELPAGNRFKLSHYHTLLTYPQFSVALQYQVNIFNNGIKVLLIIYYKYRK